MSSTDAYITENLSLLELEEIHRLWAIERVWWKRWHNSEDVTTHWSQRGEDGWYDQNIELLGMTISKRVRVIDMQEERYFDPIAKEERTIGWVPCERILPWKPGVTPSAINWFIKRFFGRELFGYQLYFYYLCQSNMLLVGGRGSAKTVGLALAAATWVSLHPGQSWAHFAYTGSQAMELYREIDDLGSQRYPIMGEDYASAPASWVDCFVANSTASPYGLIKMKPWQPGDPGTELIIRPGAAAGGYDSPFYRCASYVHR